MLYETDTLINSYEVSDETGWHFFETFRTVDGLIYTVKTDRYGNSEIA